MCRYKALASGILKEEHFILYSLFFGDDSRNRFFKVTTAFAFIYFDLLGKRMKEVDRVSYD